MCMGGMEKVASQGRQNALVEDFGRIQGYPWQCHKNYVSSIETSTSHAKDS